MKQSGGTPSPGPTASPFRRVEFGRGLAHVGLAMVQLSGEKLDASACERAVACVGCAVMELHTALAITPLGARLNG